MWISYWNDDGFRDIVSGELIPKKEQLEGIFTKFGWCISPPCSEEDYVTA